MAEAVICEGGFLTPHVVVLLVNYNGARDTIECISSLRACGYENMHIIVVDNGSTDDSLSHLKSMGPGVTLVETSENLGFTGGNNVGFQHALKRNPSYILLLNNDTLVEPGFLQYLVDAIEIEANIGAVGGLICYFPEKERVWYAGGDFVPWKGSSFSNHENLLLETILVNPDPTVSFISGCMMLLRTSALQRSGLFNNRFFLYMEDAELSLRLISAGYKLRYTHDARIYHKIAHRGDRPFQLYFTVRNRLLLLELAPRSWSRYVGIAYVHLTLMAKLVYWAFHRQDLFRAAWYGLHDYYRREFSMGRGFMFQPTAPANHRASGV